MLKSALYYVLDRVPRFRDFAAHLRLTHAMGGIAKAHAALGHYEEVAKRRVKAAEAAIAGATRRRDAHQTGISAAVTLRHNLTVLTTTRLGDEQPAETE